jgi:transposase
MMSDKHCSIRSGGGEKEGAGFPAHAAHAASVRNANSLRPCWPQLACTLSIRSNVLREWKVTVLKGMAGLFEKNDSIETLRNAYEQQLEERYAQIGRLTTQLTWLKKIWSRP